MESVVHSKPVIFTCDQDEVYRMFLANLLETHFSQNLATPLIIRPASQGPDAYRLVLYYLGRLCVADLIRIEGTDRTLRVAFSRNEITITEVKPEVAKVQEVRELQIP